MADSLTDGLAVVKTVKTTLATLETTLRTTQPTMSFPGPVYDAMRKARLAVDNLAEAIVQHTSAPTTLAPL